MRVLAVVVYMDHIFCFCIQQHFYKVVFSHTIYSNMYLRHYSYYLLPWYLPTCISGKHMDHELSFLHLLVIARVVPHLPDLARNPNSNTCMYARMYIFLMILLYYTRILQSIMCICRKYLEISLTATFRRNSNALTMDVT